MLARVTTFAIDGLDSRRVAVEVDVRPGLPAFTVVGLADAAVREARERVRGALLNSGFEFPLRRITANLAPAHIRKVGPGFDLGLALGLLLGSAQAPLDSLDGLAVFGELSLGGELRDCRGTLAVAEGARRAGLRGLIVPAGRAQEAALVDGLEVMGASSLRAVVGAIAGDEPIAPAVARPPRGGAAAGHPDLDLSDVRGHEGPLAALEVAAAGGHNLMFEGAPGTGKTMLARRLPSILPRLTSGEALEVTRIHSIAGLHREGGLVSRRPFRAPHHAISPPALVGGGPGPTPGEASLAHHGVLFLDELSEFPRSSLEALRQPLEDGTVTVARSQRSLTFPTRFALVAATNPCPCGYAGVPDRCRCNEAELARHRRRLSGPLLDRLDLLIAVERPTGYDLQAPARTSSTAVRERVLEARARQRRRLAGTGATCNGQLDSALVRRLVHPDRRALELLRDVYEREAMSARAHHRVLRVAQTIADLAGSDGVARHDVLTALSMRQRRSDEVAAAA